MPRRSSPLTDEQLNQWASTFIGRVVQHHKTLTSERHKVVSFELGKRRTGVWLVLDNGAMVYRKAQVLTALNDFVKAADTKIVSET